MRFTGFHSSRVLSLDQTYPATSGCPICTSNEPRKPVGRVQADPQIDLLFCPSCGGSSAARLPMPEVLADYYATYYDTGQEDKVAFHAVDRLARHILRYVPGAFFEGRKRANILDFGGGDGSLCVALARNLDVPVSASVVDYVDARQHGVAHLQLCSASELSEVEQEYDLVIASAVLEHVPQLHELMPRILECVARGGYFYARTPYVAPFLKVMKRLDFTFPAHVHDLGPLFWNQLIETFQWDAHVVLSQPSIVETSFRHAPLRSAAAHVLKLPAYFETRLRGKAVKKPLWPYVGGWEIILRRAAD